MTTSGHVIFDQMDEVIFGKPADEVVGDLVSRLEVSRVFLMVSGTLNRETDEIEKIRTVLGERYVGTFDAMPPHTPREAVIAAADQARELDVDLIITLGGGSITDAAKGVQLCLANDVRTADDMDMFRSVPGPDGKPKPPQLHPSKVRQISIPTTLSGGEFTGMSGITDERTKTKEIYSNPSIIPQAVILDPAVTVHTPEWLWLSTGIRAVDHCVEGICSHHSNVYGDAQALKGLSLLAEGLRRVKADPNDLQARLDCQMGTWLAVGVITAGSLMGASHGIGYVLGAMCEVPHGHTSCVMLPAVMRWNKSANAEKQQMVSAAMGSPDKDAADALEELVADIGMPNCLSKVGVDPEKFEQIAEASMAVPWIPLNPRPISKTSEIMEILNLALKTK